VKKPARRTRRPEGSILERKDRHGRPYFLLKYNVPQAPGEPRQQRYERVDGTEKDARQRLKELLAVIGREGYVEPSKETLADYCADWLPRHARRKNLSETTIDHMQILFESYIRHTALGRMELRKVTATHLEAHYDWLITHTFSRGKPLRRSSARNVHGIFFSALKAARKEGKIAVNPAEDVEFNWNDEGRSREPRVLTQGMSRELLRRLLERDHWLYEPVLIGLTCGLRRGEILGLRRRDVYLDHGLLRVEQSVVRKGSGYLVKAPKTKESRRPVTLPDATVTVLRALLVKQDELAAKLGAKPSPDWLLFPKSPDQPTTPRTPGHMTQELCRFGARNGIPLSPHVMRHSHASLLLDKNEPLPAVSARLGHADPSITARVYSHALKETERRAAKAMDDIFGALPARTEANGMDEKRKNDVRVMGKASPGYGAANPMTRKEQQDPNAILSR
jgi:integrase